MQSLTKLMLALLMAGCVALVGCENGGDGDGSENTADLQNTVVNVTGTWTGTVDGISTALRLTQSGTSVSGTMTGWPPNETCDGTHNVTGSISGSTVSLHVTCPDPAGDVNDWTVTVDGNVMTGDIQATRSS